MGTSNANFCTSLCQIYRCSPEQCKVIVFWQCLHRRVVPWVKWIEWFWPSFFQRDYLLVEEAMQVGDSQELNAVIRTYYYDCQTQENFWHNTLRFRLSGRRLLRLYTTACMTMALQETDPSASAYLKVARASTS